MLLRLSLTIYRGDKMVQELEIHKAKNGVTAQELREVLKYGENLIGPDYLRRMKEAKLLADVSFVAEIEDGVYLISYYLFVEGRKKSSTPLKSVPSIKQYMEKIEPLFDGSDPIRLNAANSFWIDAVIKERLG
jgi:hypothetical protein